MSSLVRCGGMLVLAMLGLGEQPASVWAAEPWNLSLRRTQGETTAETAHVWQPGQTAIIVCDVWDAHHCLNAVRREVEMIPRMNAVLDHARNSGALVIHAPSSCMPAYEGHPGRKLAQEAPTAANLPAEIGSWCYRIPAEEEAVYPLDQSDGGEDDDPVEHAAWHQRLAGMGRVPKTPWLRQIETLRIAPGDAISDSGVEIWNLMESRGIKNVIVFGVHTNMCVLGRPFGLRQLAQNGKDVVLMRDLTDTMYNPKRWPYVTHCVGTDRILAHIERFVCPTISSEQLVGGEPFRFQEDRRRIVMVIGDDEYKTEVSLPEYARTVLEPAGFEVTVIHASTENKHDFPGLAEALDHADLLLLSARRRFPKEEQLAAVKAFVASGRPVVGIRTANHAFAARPGTAIPEGHAAWNEIDRELFGGHYTNHYGPGPSVMLAAVPGMEQHPILGQVDLTKLTGRGTLYQTAPLNAGTTPLLSGSIPEKPAQPLAWTNRSQSGGGRVFYTSLGHLDDFAQPEFRQLLLNAICWGVETAAPKVPAATDVAERPKGPPGPRTKP
jgi:nicotinamidase-related amidase